MTKIQITTDLYGRLTPSSFAKIQSSLGGLIGTKLAALALPEIQRQIQRQIQQHKPAPSQPTKFVRIADLCAKSAKPPLRLVSGFPPQMPDPTMRPVESSGLRRAGYSQANCTLRIEFKTGSVWDYLQVPILDYEKLMKAESPGGYFHAHIRNRFQSRKVL